MSRRIRRTHEDVGPLTPPDRYLKYEQFRMEWTTRNRGLLDASSWEQPMSGSPDRTGLTSENRVLGPNVEIVPTGQVLSSCRLASPSSISMISPRPF